MVISQTSRGDVEIRRVDVEEGTEERFADYGAEEEGRRNSTAHYRSHVWGPTHGHFQHPRNNEEGGIEQLDANFGEVVGRQVGGHDRSDAFSGR